MCSETLPGMLFCQLQLIWTFIATLRRSSQNSSSSGASFDAYFHTQACPPDCLGFGSSGVVAYVEQCPRYHIGSECRDPSTAAVAGCAFGTPPRCQLCPDHAACPGGFRAWPGPGYWTSHEASGLIYPCSPPRKSRCLGWSVREQQSSCGVGYDPTVPLCGSCLSGYFPRDGGCIPCESSPVETLGGSALLLIAYVLAAVAVFFLVLAFVLTRAFQVTGLPVTRGLGFSIAGEVTVWLLSTVQVLIQLTRTPSPGLPLWLRNAFSFIQALESDITGLVPSGCRSASAFQYMQVVCSVCIAATFIFGLAGGCHLFRGRLTSGRQALANAEKFENSSPCKPFLPWIQFLSGLIATLLYGPSLLKALTALQCVEIMRAVITSQGLTFSTIQAWGLDTRIACYEGQHKITAALAWITLGAVGIGLPTVLYLFTSIHLRQFLVAEQSSTIEHNCASKSANRNDDQKVLPQKPRFRCLSWWKPLFRTYPEPVHSHLRQMRRWIGIYGYGQPWVRPTSISLTMLVTVLSSLLPAEDHALPRAIILGALLVAIAAASVWPSITIDYQWSSWKRWPRALAYLVSAALVILQSVLALSLEGGIAVIVLSWLVAIFTAMLPVTLVLSLTVWLTGMVSCRQFWCCRCCRSCCCRSASHVRVEQGDGLSAMLNFTLSFSGEKSVKDLVNRVGRSSVVIAMASSNPGSAMRIIDAQQAPTSAFQRVLPSLTHPNSNFYKESTTQNSADGDVNDQRAATPSALWVSTPLPFTLRGDNDSKNTQTTLLEGARGHQQRRMTVVSVNPLFHRSAEPASSNLDPPSTQNAARNIGGRSRRGQRKHSTNISSRQGRSLLPTGRIRRTSEIANNVYEGLVQRQVGEGISRSLKSYARSLAISTAPNSSKNHCP